MRNMYIALLSAGAALLVGCGSTQVSSVGKPYEMFVVSSPELWQSAAGDTLRAYLADEVEMVNQPEPKFTLYNVPQGGYKSTVSKHRNILILRTGDRYPVSDMTARYDVNAQPQLEVTVTSPSTDSLAAFLHRYGADLTRLFEITERDRLVARAEKYRDPKIGPLIREKFGFEMSIPQGYRVRLDTTDFLWISFELPLASVRLTRPIPKGKIFAVMEEIKKIKLSAPVEEGTVVISNVLGLGSDVMVTKAVERQE